MPATYASQTNYSRHLEKASEVHFEAQRQLVAIDAEIAGLKALLKLLREKAEGVVQRHRVHMETNFTGEELDDAIAKEYL